MLGACLLDRGWIMAHIPHQGRMCLLDEVLSWDAEHISCRTRTHRDLDHPLRAHGRLGIACGVEYAAQAMAVHGALAAVAAPPTGAPPTDTAPTGTTSTPATPTPTTPTPTTLPAAARPVAGVLAAMRGVQLYASRLDDVQGDLLVNASRVAGDQGSALYDFELRAGTLCLLRGRATVLLDANGRLQP